MYTYIYTYITWGTGVKDLFYLPALAAVHKPKDIGAATKQTGLALTSV